MPLRAIVAYPFSACCICLIKKCPNSESECGHLLASSIRFNRHACLCFSSLCRGLCLCCHACRRDLRVRCDNAAHRHCCTNSPARNRPAGRRHCTYGNVCSTFFMARWNTQVKRLTNHADRCRLNQNRLDINQLRWRLGKTNWEIGQIRCKSELTVKTLL